MDRRRGHKKKVKAFALKCYCFPFTATDRPGLIGNINSSPSDELSQSFPVSALADTVPVPVFARNLISRI